MGCPGCPFGLVPAAPFAEVIFEIVDSVVSKRLLAFVPSKLYRFGVCLFHDLPSLPVYLIAEALKAFNTSSSRKHLLFSTASARVAVFGERSAKRVLADIRNRIRYASDG
jgi:hypothetical protein